MLVIYYSEIRYKIGFFKNRQCRHKEIFLSQQLFKGGRKKTKSTFVYICTRTSTQLNILM